MEILLNRWRGTDIKGVYLYALYMFILVSLLSSFINGLVIAVLFLIGESFAWGKWVGYLVSENGEKEYSNTNGQNFPYIHQIANYFIKEKEDYLNYCRFALALRGFIWWTPILILMYEINLINWYMLTINSIILSNGFPIACELSKYWNFEYKSKYLSIQTNWEKQEIIYGVFQFLCITLSILLFAIIK